MHERSKADPFLHVAQTVSLRTQANSLRYIILAREAIAFLMIVTQLERPIQQAFHVDLFMNRLTGRGGLSLLNKVAPPKLFGSQPDRLCNLIHVPFQREDTLRRAESAKRAMRRHVRRYCFAMDADIRTEVGAGRVNRASRKHDRRERAIRAAIDHKFDLHR